MAHNFLARLVYVGVVLTLIVIMLGAYVRLSDAGLSCPDWPGCYGQLLAPSSGQAIEMANQAFPETPVEVKKAWKEMIHRYLAGLLGLVIVGIAIGAVRSKNSTTGVSPRLAFGLVFLVMFQAALGMWTVTLLLKPIVVTAHLLGGLATLALLWWMALTCQTATAVKQHRTMTLWGASALIVLLVQIVLGGWTSTNYAALSCPDFPTCQGTYWPEMDVAEGFNPLRELGRDSNGELLNAQAMTAIHWIHRLGALLTLIVVGSFAIAQTVTTRGLIRWVALLTLVLLGVQIGLGIANVLSARPLMIAVAHNAVAALLLLAVSTQLYGCCRRFASVSEKSAINVQSEPQVTV